MNSVENWSSRDSPISPFTATKARKNANMWYHSYYLFLVVLDGTFQKRNSAINDRHGCRCERIRYQGCQLCDKFRFPNADPGLHPSHWKDWESRPFRNVAYLFFCRGSATCRGPRKGSTPLIAFTFLDLKGG